jgi:hypothetical protein
MDMSFQAIKKAIEFFFILLIASSLFKREAGETDGGDGI